jgi:hypothetical protein
MHLNGNNLYLKITNLKYINYETTIITTGYYNVK